MWWKQIKRKMVKNLKGCLLCEQFPAPLKIYFPPLFTEKKKVTHKKMSCKFHCIFQTQPHEAVKNVKRDLWMPLSLSFLQPTNILHKLLCCLLCGHTGWKFCYFFIFNIILALWCMLFYSLILHVIYKNEFLQAWQELKIS